MSEIEFEYTPNEISSDMFLSEIPLALMKENIVAQFNDPLEYRKKDHITTFLNMYKYSLDNVNIFEDEETDNITELRDNFYSFMISLFKDYLGLGFVNFNDMNDEDQDNLIHFTYRFFIVNIKKNFVGYIMNYIKENQNEFIDNDDKRKDVTSLALKKEIGDIADAHILSNLSNIIDTILNNCNDIDEFFRLCSDEDILETRFVSDAFNNLQITGNFIEKYVAMVDIDFKSEIESKIRNKILKKYKN